MSYSKVTFSAIVPLNLINLNMLGSQYTDMKADIEGHNHDSDYYTKTVMDETFVHENNDGHESGANADTIDGLTKAQLMNSVMDNLIVWFYNASIPDGWHICDGTNGTVNAVNKYIIGADGDTIFDTGGNDVFSPSINITIDEHVLTIDEIPSHRHTYIETHKWRSQSWTTPSGINIPADSANSKFTGYTGSDQGHSHTGSITFDNVDNRPKTKCLYLIQKISS